VFGSSRFGAGGIPTHCSFFIGYQKRDLPPVASGTSEPSCQQAPEASCPRLFHQPTVVGGSSKSRGAACRSPVAPPRWSQETPRLAPSTSAAPSLSPDRHGGRVGGGAAGDRGPAARWRDGADGFPPHRTDPHHNPLIFIHFFSHIFENFRYQFPSFFPCISYLIVLEYHRWPSA